ncbi:MAG: hypothetical protein ACI9LM_001704 [Alteromonadaceae bacterium]
MIAVYVIVALGTVGLIIVTIAAAFSTGSAINATLFATARLTHYVAEKGEFPAALVHKNIASYLIKASISSGVSTGSTIKVRSATFFRRSTPRRGFINILIFWIKETFRLPGVRISLWRSIEVRRCSPDQS